VEDGQFTLFNLPNQSLAIFEIRGTALMHIFSFFFFYIFYGAGVEINAPFLSL
jgi:hypothetical protein